MRETQFPRSRRTPCRRKRSPAHPRVRSTVWSRNCTPDKRTPWRALHDGKRDPSAARALIRIRESPRFVQD